MWCCLQLWWYFHNASIWFIGAVRPQDLWAAGGGGRGQVDGSACRPPLYQVHHRHHHQHVDCEWPLWLISPKAFLRKHGRDSVSMFTNKLKPDGDYAEVRSFLPSQANSFWSTSFPWIFLTPPFPGWFWPLWEHPVDELADDAVQAAPSRRQDWLEGWVQVHSHIWKRLFQ